MRRLEEKLRNPKGYITLTERIKRVDVSTENESQTRRRSVFGTRAERRRVRDSSILSEGKEKKGQEKESISKKKVKKKSPPKKIVPKKKKVQKRHLLLLLEKKVREDLLNITSEEWPFQSETEIQESIESRLRVATS